jgi:Immunity protein 53
MKPSPLEEWYASRCDGIWEHGFGVSIETLDNPGWRVKIALRDTPKELQNLDRAVIQRENENDWIQYWSKDKEFHAACGPLNLSEALEIFVQWFNSK